IGQSGNGIGSGFNARNRVTLTTNAVPGETFQIAVLGTNGPIANLPDNYIWVRSATLDFYKERPQPEGWSNLGEVIAFDPALKNIISTDEKIQKLADGFQFTEGPVWSPDGYLLFSDPNTNVIYRYDPVTKNISIYMTKSGYTGVDIGEYHQPGSNGLAFDKDGRLIVCQHGNRRVVRIEKKGPVTILADQYNGQKLNSPNDLVVHSSGAVYFTDPPYGLPGNYTDQKKETPFQGVYKIDHDKATLLTTALGGPNGIAFSPDEKFLYVGNWDIRDIWNTKTVWRFPVLADGTLGKGDIFYNFDQTSEAEAIDGIKIDVEGNLFVSAPGGVWILSSAGKLLGKIVGPERPANMAWGEDGKTLFLTAHTGLYQIHVKTGGRITASSTSSNSTVKSN
ncbi:MAG: SMP-30/gluconolactonase/LRE family protein, partial [Saprospiraceae bacterium]